VTIAENVKSVKARIAAAAISSGRKPEDILLVAATKMNDAERVRQAVAAGVDACGENRVQELQEKKPLGAYEGAPLHFIGHLQKNKVKYLVGQVDLIESVDSLELLEAIDKRAAGLGAVQDVLLEVNIGGEEAKSGFRPEDVCAAAEKAGNFANIRVRGLMAIPPVCASPDENRPYFARMRQLFIDIGAKKYDNVTMDFLSMGMTGDFEAAIAEGANMVRVGTGIFGARDYGPVR
jgi:pyridoxal phosphate enzyme (YggS family)